MYEETIGGRVKRKGDLELLGGESIAEVKEGKHTSTLGVFGVNPRAENTSPDCGGQAEGKVKSAGTQHLCSEVEQKRTSADGPEDEKGAKVLQS